MRRLAVRPGWRLLQHADHCSNTCELDGTFPKKPSCYLTYNIDPHLTLAQCHSDCPHRLKNHPTRHSSLSLSWHANAPMPSSSGSAYCVVSLLRQRYRWGSSVPCGTPAASMPRTPHTTPSSPLYTGIASPSPCSNDLCTMPQPHLRRQHRALLHMLQLRHNTSLWPGHVLRPRRARS